MYGGRVTSHYSIGEYFEEARGGVPQSDTEAVLWYYEAAKLGDGYSMDALERLEDIARILLPVGYKDLYGSVEDGNTCEFTSNLIVYSNMG